MRAVPPLLCLKTSGFITERAGPESIGPPLFFFFDGRPSFNTSSVRRERNRTLYHRRMGL